MDDVPYFAFADSVGRPNTDVPMPNRAALVIKKKDRRVVVVIVVVVPEFPGPSPSLFLVEESYGVILAAFPVG